MIYLMPEPGKIPGRLDNNHLASGAAAVICTYGTIMAKAAGPALRESSA
jgi:hypothetical protein